MLTNRHRQAGTGGAGATAQAWPCLPGTRRGGLAAAAVGVCLSQPSAAYLLGGEPGLMGAISIKNSRFADQRNNQI